MQCTGRQPCHVPQEPLQPSLHSAAKQAEVRPQEAVAYVLQPGAVLHWQARLGQAMETV